MASVKIKIVNTKRPVVFGWLKSLLALLTQFVAVGGDFV